MGCRDATSWQAKYAFLDFGSCDYKAYPCKAELRANLRPVAPTQRAIVAEIEAEQAPVAANCGLIARFEAKIIATLARVWGEREHCQEPITASYPAREVKAAAV